MPTVINGAGTRSYKKCIDPKCSRLPENMLEGENNHGYEFIIPFCNAHQSVAREVSARIEGAIFSLRSGSEWLRKVQIKELQATLREGKLNKA